MTVTVIDDAAVPVVVLRTIIVTPENPGSVTTGPSSLDAPAIQVVVTAIAASASSPGVGAPPVQVSVTAIAASASAPGNTLLVPAIAVSVGLPPATGTLPAPPGNRPVNDDRAGAIELVGTSANTTGVFTGVTANSAEDHYGYAVWYSFTPAYDGDITFAVYGSSGRTNTGYRLSTWAINGATVTLVASANVPSGDNVSLTHPGVAGQGYYLAVEATSPAVAVANPTFSLYWTGNDGPPPTLTSITPNHTVMTTTSDVLLDVVVIGTGFMYDGSLQVEVQPFFTDLDSYTVVSSTEARLRLLIYAHNSAGPGTFTLSFTNGWASNLLAFTLTALPSSGPPLVDANPITVAVVAVTGRIPGAEDTVVAPPITVSVTVPKPLEALAVPPVTVAVTVPKPLEALAAPPIDVRAGLGEPTAVVAATLVMTQPADGEVIATHTPQFIVGLTQLDETQSYTIEVQYDDTVDFTSPVTLSRTIDGVTGGVFLDATDPVADAGFWRVRLLLDGNVQIDWSAPLNFTVNAVVVTVELPVSWTVDPSADRLIHLWHFDPPGCQVGDLVTIYGQGFPLTPGSLLLGEQVVPVLSWELIAASTATDDAVINGSVVDPEHFEVTFIAPEIEAPGGPLTVGA